MDKPRDRDKTKQMALDTAKRFQAEFTILNLIDFHPDGPRRSTVWLTGFNLPEAVKRELDPIILQGMEDLNDKILAVLLREGE